MILRLLLSIVLIASLLANSACYQGKILRCENDPYLKEGMLPSEASLICYIVDIKDRPLWYADIVLYDCYTGGQKAISADENGCIYFVGLDPDRKYNMLVKYRGFISFKKNNVSLVKGKVSCYIIKLQPSPFGRDPYDCSTE